jgi:hypothetical protein
MARVEKPERGLPSLNESRVRRRRAIVLGRVQLREAAPRFWLWLMVVLGAFAVVYWRYAEGQLSSAKSAVMAKQRAIASVLGPRIDPFRDRIEKWTLELAGNWQGDQVAPGASLAALEGAPAVYLRLLLKNATSPESIRKAAEVSVRDGFTSCLLPQKQHGVTPGPSCKSPGDCSLGQICDEYGTCAPPGEPFNLRIAYRAMRILSTKWTDDLHNAENDLSVRIFDRDLDKVAANDVPIAIDLLTRSKYFVLVLDEDPKEGLPEPINDVARAETEAERIQRASHLARIGVWDLKTDTQVVRLLGDAAGKIVPVGERGVTDPPVVAAQQRQINNCALALAVRESLEKSGSK